MVDNQTNKGEGFFSLESVVPGVQLMMGIDRRIRKAILDYALGAAILGLIPVYGRWIAEIRLALLIILNLKMIIQIGRFWGYHRGQDLLAVIGAILAILGTFALGLMTWIIVLILGLFVPLLDSLARATAYGVFTWSMGRTVSRYYYSPQALDVEALKKALQFHQWQHNRNLRK